MAFDFSVVNGRYKDFEITKYLSIEEIGSILIELTHIPTGASVVHLKNDDKENVFCISFQTTPDSSNGVAHILEHTVLCGSKKFPVKDPFFSMTRRSLNTFMNAFTGSDFTCYPASSELEKDFYNLLEVYLDATFHPELKKLSFLQEGWRYEFDDKSLKYKGIVFNEMKGALSSADQRTWGELMKHLTPDLTYTHNSGGDPKDIPNLSYEGLIDFHKKYYHPSHALFFFYGNIPLEKHLDFIQKNALDNVTKIPPLQPIGIQKKFKTPKQVISHFPAIETSSLDDKIIFTIGFLTAPITDAEELLSLMLLDSILMDTDASPLKRPLLESGLCSEANSYLDTEISQVPFIIFCKGCDKKKIDLLKQTIFDTIKKIASEKIDQSLIDAALHQLEFSRSEISQSRMPYGLSLFLRSCLGKQHGCVIEDSLKIHTLFDHLRKKAAEKNFFHDLIHKYLLDNPHRVELKMLPDPNLSKKEEMEEKEKLNNISKKLTKEQIENIHLQTKQLEEFQKKLEIQDIECLPKVGISDISKDSKYYSLHSEKLKQIDCHFHDCFTNRILYADLHFPLPKLNDQELLDIPFFTSLMTDLGTKNSSYDKLLEEMNRYTGGIYAYTSTPTSIKNPNIIYPTFAIRGKALYHNSEKLFELFFELITSCDFSNKDRLTQVLEQQHSYLEHKVNSSALKYATSLASAGNSLPSYLNELWNGISYFHRLEHIMKNKNSEIDKLIDRLFALKDKLLNNKNLELVISCDQDHYAKLKKENFYSLNDLKLEDYTPWDSHYKIPPAVSHFQAIASPVAFTSLSYQLVGYTDDLSPYLLIATNLLENTYLHKKIREEGGAYGSGASYSPTGGGFLFHTYRDPHIISSLNSIEKAILKIANQDFTDKELDEAKLGIFQGLDSPVSPGSRASLTYRLEKEGKTKQIRNIYREKLLNASKADISNAVSKHLVNPKKKPTLVSFSGKELLEKENDKLIASNKTPYPIKSSCS